MQKNDPTEVALQLESAAANASDAARDLVPAALPVCVGLLSLAYWHRRARRLARHLHALEAQDMGHTCPLRQEFANRDPEPEPESDAPPGSAGGNVLNDEQTITTAEAMRRKEAGEL